MQGKAPLKRYNQEFGSMEMVVSRNILRRLGESHRAKLPDFKTVVTIPVQAVEKE